MGGDSQKGSLTSFRASSAKAHCTGKQPSYLTPNSGSLHVPIEGVYCVAEKIEEEFAIGEKTAQNNVETRVYLERIRNRMHEPIEGLSVLATASTKNNADALNKGAIEKNRTTVQASCASSNIIEIHGKNQL